MSRNFSNGFENVNESKSLTEVAADIMKGKGTYNDKKAALVKIGISSKEVDLVMRIWLNTHKNEMKSAESEIIFGIELEMFLNRSGMRAPSGLSFEEQGYNHRDTNQRVFKFVSDGSVSGMSDPIECVSPILKGEDGLSAVEQVCAVINARNARVNKSCGYHVHINASDLSSEAYANVFVNYAYCEKVIDSFMAKSRRSNQAFYCKSIIGKVENCRTREEVQNSFCGGREARYCNWRGGYRYYKVNAMSWFGHRSIEFRHHGGTTNYTKIANWIKFCGLLVNWSRSNRLTSTITSVNDIPWLTDDLKAYYSHRASRLA